MIGTIVLFEETTQDYNLKKIFGVISEISSTHLKVLIFKIQEPISGCFGTQLLFSCHWELEQNDCWDTLKTFKLDSKNLH